MQLIGREREVKELARLKESSQAEFEFVQDTIRQKRADAKEAVITFANDFAEGVDQYATEYQRQTGSNFYSDIATGLMS